ncbi:MULTISPECIES: hypothetical protein [Paraburkholderia]|uniref:hypothetical protein n=1 Tax=Paraburkholderia TaxID=1822464 RepID=UPI002AB7E849|nr:MULTISPECIES: hypothetical protein [Paraburkholderia]
MTIAASLSAALITSGCAIAPASLVGTPPKPISDACVTPEKAVIARTQSGPDRLQSSLDRVRAEPIFHSVAIPAPDELNGLVTEASRIVEIARTQAAATLAKTQTAAANAGKPDAADNTVKPPITATGNPPEPPDEVENVLLTLLPWAGTIDPIQADAAAYAHQAGGVLQFASLKAKGMNALLPNAQQAANTASNQQKGSRIIASFDVVEHREKFRDLTTLASFRAFHLLALLSAAHLHKLLTTNPAIEDDKLDTEVRVFNVARFLSAYFDAYFRGGQFLQVSFDEKDFVATLATRIKQQLPKPGNASPTAEAIAAWLQPAFDQPDEQSFVRSLASDFHNNLPASGIGSLTVVQIQALLQPAFDNLCKQAGHTSSTCLSTPMGKSAFVTRAGLSVQFSGVSFAIGGKDSIGISHTYPQVANFGPQLIRVFVEALFDANGPHPPAVPNSTACDPANNLFRGDECVTAGTPADLRRQQIDMISAGAEALSSSETGVIIRGAGWASLNNELVASLLETLVGVNARKISEKVLYSVSEKLECPLTTAGLHVDGD